MGESLKDLPSEAAWRPILRGGDEIWRLEPGHGLTLQSKENWVENQTQCEECTRNPGARNGEPESEEKPYKSVNQESQCWEHASMVECLLACLRP